MLLNLQLYGFRYSALVEERCIAISLSVCPRAYLWNRWTDLHKIVCADPLGWPWLSPPGGVAICCVLPVLWRT